MKDLSSVLEKTLKGAGEILTEGFHSSPGQLTKKGRVDLVTEWDRRSESYIRQTIQTSFPLHSILGEEEGGSFKDSGYLWVIDPLDGTTNFVHKHSYFAVSIACLKDGETILGGVYAPILDLLFLAELGQGSSCNQERLRVSTTEALSDALFVTGFPYERSGWIEPLTRMLGNALTHLQGVRRMGSAALDLCHLASGVYDIYIEFELKPWDIAAGLLILKEAGGVASLTDNSPIRLDAKELVASNGLLHSLALEKLLAGVV